MDLLGAVAMKPDWRRRGWFLSGANSIALEARDVPAVAERLREQPPKFDLAVNLTAGGLGLAIARSLLALAEALFRGLTAWL